MRIWTKPHGSGQKVCGLAHIRGPRAAHRRLKIARKFSTGPVHNHVEIGRNLWTCAGVLWRSLWDRKNVGNLCRIPLRGVTQAT